MKYTVYIPASHWNNNVYTGGNDGEEDAGSSLKLTHNFTLKKYIKMNPILASHPTKTSSNTVTPTQFTPIKHAY